MVTDTTWTHCGEHLELHTNTASLYCTTETIKTLYLNYTSIFKKEKYWRKLFSWKMIPGEYTQMQVEMKMWVNQSKYWVYKTITTTLIGFKFVQN